MISNSTVNGGQNGGVQNGGKARESFSETPTAPALPVNDSNANDVAANSDEKDSRPSERNPAPGGDAIPELIPVRMLNEFAYCPRLGYLEWVDGEWEENFETLNGSFAHRRVDRPSGKRIPAPKGNASNGKGRESFSETPTESALPANGSETNRRATSPGEKDSRPSTTQALAARKTFDANGKETRPEQLHARSLLLSAVDEGLVAKLDLMELNGTSATPVDYKRGKAPNVPEGAWEPERVQLCAQGLVLRENGFQCDEGVLYFIGSRKRVTIQFTDELVARTRELARQFRTAAAGDVAPPPLVDSRKCPRCSLVGICLPDEVNLLREVNRGGKGRESFSKLPTTSAFVADDSTTDKAVTTTGEKDSRPSGVSGPNASRDDASGKANGTRSVPATLNRVRKLLPARENALPFYVQEQGAMLCKSADRLLVKKKGEVIGERRLIDVSQVSLFGSITVTAAALRELNIRGIAVCHFSYGGWFHGMTTGLVHKNVELRIRQYAIAADADASLQISKKLIVGKIRNARTLLRRHLPKCEKPRLDQLADFCKRAARTTSAESLLGIEGMAAKIYFAGLFRMMGERHDFDVNDRNRRPPKDPVNAVLSFAYALLAKELTVVLQAVGFDPMLGVFHRPRYGRPSLALDLAEEYRPLIADSVMITAFNNGELGSSDFLERAGAVTLTKSGRAALIATFERRMTTEVTHPLFGYRISYRRLLEVQARLLSRTMLGELEDYPAFCTR